MADSLHLSKPTLTFEGHSWYNRICSQMMRSIGLEELAATNPEEYVAEALKPIRDDRYHLRIGEHLESREVDDVIFDNESSAYFKQAFDHIAATHEQLRNEKTNRALTFEDFG